MKTFLIVASLIAACAASTLEIVSSPSNLKLPSDASTLRTTQLSSLNEYILGLSAKPVTGFNVQVDLFSRPRALALINVEGVESLGVGKSFNVESDGVDSVELDQELALVFGSDRQSVQLTAGGITGSQLAFSAQEQTVDSSVIKTKSPQLVRELEGVYRLAAAIKAAGTKLDNTADVFRVTISGLVRITDEAEKTIAINDIKNAITALNSAINTAYGNQAIVEVLATPSPIVEKLSSSDDAHHIAKRDAASDTAAATAAALTAARKSYQVSVSVGLDYPAIFAIFLGLVLILALALIYIVVAMASIDPEKDSIIYRMTTTRMKKD